MYIKSIVSVCARRVGGSMRHFNATKATIALRCYCRKSPESQDKTISTTTQDKVNEDQAPLNRYKAFRDEDSPIIFDVEEERLLKRNAQTTQLETRADEFEGLRSERGARGVFDVHEVVSLLKNQKAKEIVVIAIPPSYCYVDHMILATGSSRRHVFATTEYIHRAFKRKCSPTDRVPRIEAPKNSEWMALDLGNIVLHTFLKETRTLFDLESLWAVGAEFDPHLNHLENNFTDTIKSLSVDWAAQEHGSDSVRVDQ